VRSNASTNTTEGAVSNKDSMINLHPRLWGQWRCERTL